MKSKKAKTVWVLVAQKAVECEVVEAQRETDKKSGSYVSLRVRIGPARVAMTQSHRVEHCYPTKTAALRVARKRALSELADARRDSRRSEKYHATQERRALAKLTQATEALAGAFRV